MPRLNANLTLLFNEVAFPERFKAAADAGFKAVEFLFPYAWPALDIKEWLDEANLELVLFNAPPGDWNAGERGLACHPDHVDEFKENVELALDYAKALKPRCLHIMAGLSPKNFTAEEARQTLLCNLDWATHRCDEAGIQALIEPLNLGDNPGYFLHDFDDAIRLISDLRLMGKTAPKLQFDIYHCAKIYGDVLPWIKKTAGEIEHFQIADPLHRHEPNPVNLPLSEIFHLIDSEVPGVFVGCEYFPSKDTFRGLGWVEAYESTSF
jgi:hydroxypyruvate isomerase